MNAGIATYVDAAPAHAACLEALHAASVGRDEPYWQAKAFEILLAAPPVGGLLAIVRETPVGFVLWRTAADEAEILLLAVVPERRRAGQGRALLRRALAKTRAAGAKVVSLEVAADNPAPLGLYRSEGFERIGVRRGYYTRLSGPRADALVLQRQVPVDVEIFTC